MKKTKEQLLQICKEQLQSSIAEIEQLIADAREATANETKSSMGDKYETTREMLQQEINMNMERLKKAQKDLSVLTGLNTEETTAQVALGSLVTTNNGSFYIAVSIGKTTLNNQHYFVISHSSPIGKLLFGKAVDEEVSFNNKKYIIRGII